MTDITLRVNVIGNQAKAYSDANGKGWTYACNVWDLQSIGSLLFAGCGNSSNGVDPNPDKFPNGVPLLAYDASNPGAGWSSIAISGSVFDADQIDLFRVIDFGAGDQIVFPNHDPTGTNNVIWYRRESGTWVRYARNPVTGDDVKHNYDLCLDGSTLLMATGGNVTPCWIAPDHTAETIFNEASLSPVEGFRAYSIFKIGGKTYIAFAWNWNGSAETYGGGLWRWDGAGTITFTRLTFATPSGVLFANVFPGLTQDFTSANMRRCLVSGTTLFYVCAQNINDHQWTAKAAFKAPQASSSGGIGTSSRVAHPIESTAVPWDILDRSGKIYILWSHTSGASTIVSVTSSSDYSTWIEEFRFTTDTFARSFEEISGIWYFGMGSQTTSIPASVGNILAYDSAASVTPNPPPMPICRLRHMLVR